MTEVWRGTYADIPASVRMVGSTPRAFLGERIVFQEDEIAIFRKALAKTDLPDPRPSDMAELARLVAIELRKMAIHGAVSLANNRAITVFGCLTVDYSLLFSDFDNRGPIACAQVIKDFEAVRAQEWAGDK